LRRLASDAFSRLSTISAPVDKEEEEEEEEEEDADDDDDDDDVADGGEDEDEEGDEDHDDSSSRDAMGHFGNQMASLIRLTAFHSSALPNKPSSHSDSLNASTSYSSEVANAIAFPCRTLISLLIPPRR
jgi:ABC-type Zn2+ transport system substrate-binding protein/surface adhesin